MAFTLVATVLSLAVKFATDNDFSKLYAMFQLNYHSVPIYVR